MSKSKCTIRCLVSEASVTRLYAVHAVGIDVLLVHGLHSRPVSLFSPVSNHISSLEFS